VAAGRTTPYCRSGIRTPLAVPAWVIIGTIIGAAIFFSPQNLMAQTQPVAPKDSRPPSAIVIGFPGGLVHSDDPRRPEVHIARHLRATYGDSVRVEVFQNRQREQAHKFILYWLGAGEDGKLSEGKKRGVTIILVGHSWGGSTVVSLARVLERDGIPVSLTVQVDSITKHGENDSLIPANVAEAANFYQTGGVLHGIPEIRAADPSRTRILGNFRLQYDKTPADCRNFPWYDLIFFKKHIAIECDPCVESQIERLIRKHLPAAPASAQNSAETMREAPATNGNCAALH